MAGALERIRQWGLAYLAHGGVYLLPLLAIALVGLRAALSSPSATRRLSGGARRVAGRGLALVLGAAVVLSIGVYNNFFNFHYAGYLNAYEFFHYYLGSKYAREVGYFGLYGAALVADDDTGRMYRPADGLLTDLATHRSAPVEAVLAEAPRYRSPFTDERWNEWVADVFFFKKRLGHTAWNRLFHDKGYNATPAWTAVVGGLLSGRIPTSSGPGMGLLAALDALLLLGATIAVGRAFDAWTASMMVVLAASSYLMAHVHMKGAFLRTDFVVCLILAICLLKQGHRALAGALVGYATMSRVFPVIFLWGPLAAFAWSLRGAAHAALLALRRRAVGGGWQRLVGPALVAAPLAVGGAACVALWAAAPRAVRQLSLGVCGSPAACLGLGTLLAAGCFAAAALAAWGSRRGLVEPGWPRFLGGFAVAIAVLFVASVGYAGRVGVWSEFAQKMALHRGQPHIWDVGLRTVVAGELVAPDESSIFPAARLRPELLARREIALRLAQLVALALSALAARGLADHRALALGFVPTFFLVAPTYYYYIVLLVPFLFFAERARRPSGVAGLAYLFLLGMAGHVLYGRFEQYFTTYYWNAVMVLGLATLMLGVALAESRRRLRGREP